ncbi:MAG: beta-propeller fold lactonase family protein [Pseudomonadota bacterium]|nr:beta-propeller fold lactonase family protein [Pseudomonadota bacterium]
MRAAMRPILRFLLSASLFGGLTAAQAAPLAYVTNERAGVSVIDLDQLTVQRTLDVGGQGPRGLGLSADGRLLVTANKGTSDISVIDTVSGQVLRRIPVGKNVEFVRVADDIAYVTYEPGVSGAGEGKAGADAAKAGKDDKDDDQIPAEIAVVDIKQGKVLRSMKSGRETEGIEFSADGSQMLVANEGDNTVTVYDRAKGTVLQRVDLSGQGSRPRGIKISPDGKTYAVTFEFSDRLVLIDSRFKVLKSVATRKSPYGVSYDPSGHRIYVAASRASVIQVFDADSLAVIGEIPVGGRCWHFSLIPEAKRLIAACGKSDNLIVADTDTFAVLKTLPGAQAPWGIVTFPRARGSIDTP